MDIYGIMPGREVVIIGSGDVGLVMARRFAPKGAKVKAVIEILPYPGGLMRNVVQCLRDYNIPLLLGHTVVKVVGKKES
jgi:NADPH-dependent 2,4-dienoyl-CoA reductase/sulfur reductase-like enzyme